MPDDEEEVNINADLHSMYFHCRKVLNNYFSVDYYGEGGNPDAVLQS